MEAVDHALFHCLEYTGQGQLLQNERERKGTECMDSILKQICTYLQNKIKNRNLRTSIIKLNSWWR